MRWDDLMRYQTVPGGWFADLYPEEGNRCGAIDRAASSTGTFAKPAGMTEINTAKIAVDLRYMSSENFTGKTMYPSNAKCYLVDDVAASLNSVRLPAGYQLQVLDCYRPREIQRQFAAWCSSPQGVINGNRCRPGLDVAGGEGGSHPAGRAVDITLLKNGSPATMPSKFDEFGNLAKSNRCTNSYPDCVVLKNAMIAAGFEQYSLEWWHFSK